MNILVLTGSDKKSKKETKPKSRGFVLLLYLSNYIKWSALVFIFKISVDKAYNIIQKEKINTGIATVSLHFQLDFAI